MLEPIFFLCQIVNIKLLKQPRMINEKLFSEIIFIDGSYFAIRFKCIDLQWEKQQKFFLASNVVLLNPLSITAINASLTGLTCYKV